MDKEDLRTWRCAFLHIVIYLHNKNYALDKIYIKHLTKDKVHLWILPQHFTTLEISRPYLEQS